MPRYLPILCLLAVLIPAVAQAGSIALETHANSVVGEDGVVIQTTTTNLGRETAFGIEVHALFLGTSQTSGVQSPLAPGETRTTAIRLARMPGRPGAYIVPLRVDFRDANGHPFSSMAHASFVYQEGAFPDVLLSFKDTLLSDQVRFKVQVVNRDQKPHQVRVRLALPRELEAQPLEQETSLKPQQKTNLTFTLGNLYATEGSSYPILAILDYEGDGLHHAMVSEGMVTVRVLPPPFKARPWLFIGLGVALALVVILLEILLAVRTRREG